MCNFATKSMADPWVAGIFTYLDLPKGAKWLPKGVNSPSLRVSIHHPLGFNWHPWKVLVVIYYKIQPFM